jgi:hypothetical protein
MPKRFSDLLSGVVDSAATSARAPGAAAARERGRRRRIRQRFAASAISLVLLGGAGSIAAVSLTHGRTIPADNGSVSRSPGVSGSPSADVSPHTSPAASHAVSSAPVRGSSSGGPRNSTGAVSPGTFVAAAWLSAPEMPFAQAGVTTWDAQAGVGTRLSGGVYEQTATQFKATIGTCSAVRPGSGVADALGGGLAGAQYEIFQGSNSDKVLPDGSIPYVSWEQDLFYADTADARVALAALPRGYADCKNEITGTDPATGGTVVGQIQQTLAGSSAQCWSILGGGTIQHACYVRSGAVIAAVDVTVHQVSSLSTVNFSSIDSTEVPELQQSLRAYANGS